VNLFYLDTRPERCATLHCDKHVVKMIIEYAQLMSTAHRMLDGIEYQDKTKLGRKIRRWKHPNNNMDGVLYKASHINHPTAVWARGSYGNYRYLYDLFCALCDEYTYRYGKVHMTDSKLRQLLEAAPMNIPDRRFYAPPRAMPDDCKKYTKNVIQAYHKYYRLYKKDFAKWTNRPVPSFMRA